MLKGYCISDIHFGSMNSKELFSQLSKVFLKRISKLEKNDIQLVVISGDLLDHKLSFNSEDSKLCINFINKLASYSKKKGFSIRIIKGTKNHDLDQLNNFLYLQKRIDIDFKIINKVQEEEFKGYKILYVPEEYMQDAKSYYKDYFSKENYYDIAFVHGTFNHVEFVSKTIKSERPISNAPVFSYKEFSKIVKGPVLCGHIHIAQNYKNKIYYTGSFSRWKYGEEKAKGFLSFELEDNDEFKVKFIKNKYAEKYITKDIEDFINLNDTENIEKDIKKIKEWKEKNDVKNLRIIIDKKFNDGVNLEVIKKYFSDNEENNVKISTKNSVKREKLEDNELEEKYSFIFKNQDSISKIISKYLKIHDNISLSESVIEELLNSEE